MAVGNLWNKSLCLQWVMPAWVSAQNVEMLVARPTRFYNPTFIPQCQKNLALQQKLLDFLSNCTRSECWLKTPVEWPRASLHSWPWTFFVSLTAGRKPSLCETNNDELSEQNHQVGTNSGIIRHSITEFGNIWVDFCSHIRFENLSVCLSGTTYFHLAPV